MMRPSSHWSFSIALSRLSYTSALIQQEKSLAGNKIPVNIVYDFQQNEVTVKFPYSIEMTGTTLPGRVLCLS